MTVHFSRVKCYLIIILFMLIGGISIKVNASEGVIDHIDLRKSGSNDDYVCTKISDNVHISEATINNRIGVIRVFLTDAEKYKVTDAYNSFTKYSKLTHNSKNPLLWSIQFSVSSQEFDSFGAQTFYLEIENVETQKKRFM